MQVCLHRENSISYIYMDSTWSGWILYFDSFQTYPLRTYPTSEQNKTNKTKEVPLNVAESILDHRLFKGNKDSVTESVEKTTVAKGYGLQSKWLILSSSTHWDLCDLVLFATQPFLFPKTFREKKEPPQASESTEHRAEQSRAKPRRDETRRDKAKFLFLWKLPSFSMFSAPVLCWEPNTSLGS